MVASATFEIVLLITSRDLCKKLSSRPVSVCLLFSSQENIPRQSSCYTELPSVVLLRL